MNLKTPNRLARLAAKLSALLLAPLILTGCWDSVEINNRSVILEFAVDKYLGDNDTSKPLDDQNRYEITYSIPDMAKISGTESLATDMKTNILVTAPTIATSLDDLETRTRNTITFSHVKVILLGEELLKDAKLFEESIDAITRGRVIARNVPILAVKGRTEDAMNVENTQQPLLGLYMMNYFNNKERPQAYFKSQLLGNFIKDMQDTGIATMPIFHLADNEEGNTEKPDDNASSASKSDISSDAAASDVTASEAAEDDGKASSTGEEASSTGYDISGGAIIKNYELVEYVDKDVVRGQLIVDGDIKNAPVVIEYDGYPLTYIIQHASSRKKFRTIDGQLSLVVELDIDGSIAEYVSTDENNIFNTPSMDEIKMLLANEILRQAFIAIDKSHEINVDFLHVGQAMYRKEPDMWDKYKPSWEDEGFRNFPIHINANVNIENTGIIQ
ncbi:MAG: hypothetical protein BEN18_10020 [Epulopiscium sp. Nuni2H_MBin001]|nr:MAG: hypothetical protein BEN18_10020 [Epulopiscium sp. Nuni2H_MBin001]